MAGAEELIEKKLGIVAGDYAADRIDEAEAQRRCEQLGCTQDGAKRIVAGLSRFKSKQART